MFRRKRSYEEIDPGIADLVAEMNRTGVITTIASCEGHPRKLYAPYVYFSSSVEVARRIEDALRDLQWDGATRKPDLAAMWKVIGYFGEDCSNLNFVLCSPEYDLYCRSLIRAWIAFGLKHKVVQRDLRVLAETISNLRLHQSDANAPTRSAENPPSRRI